MLAAADAGQSVVAAILGLGTVGLAGGVVAMVWSLQAAQIQRGDRRGRQEPDGQADDALPPPGMNGNAMNGNGAEKVANGSGVPQPSSPSGGAPREAREREAREREAREREARGWTATEREARERDARSGEGRRPGPAAPVAIEGPDSVVIGEQARYRVRRSGAQQVVAWAAGGGAVSQASDPAHPDDLLLVADRPGNLTVSVRLREGLAERRETKSVTAVANPAAVVSSVASRLLVQDWPIVTVAVLVAGFAAALVALGILGASDFIALVAPLTAVLAVLAATRGTGRPDR